MSKNRNSGLGRGLDSLIPNRYYKDDFDANSAQSLEDMLEEEADDSSVNQENDNKEVSNSSEKENVENQNDNPQKPKEKTNSSNNTKTAEKTVQEDSIVQKHVEEVLEIVRKNPRITLWSVHSSAVFRYLRKTQPEFSISNEASSLIDEVVSQKYPEIWQLFEDVL